MLSKNKLTQRIDNITDILDKVQFISIRYSAWVSYRLKLVRNKSS